MSKQLFDLDAFRAQPLPTEEEVMANWQGDIDKPVVSVLGNTFNHAAYIEDAFRGFLIQKTDFVFEVIVHDDASTDGTSDIVREYAKRYPQIFKPVIQTENQYSQGKKPTLLSSAHAKGEYIAFCEGDDFWINENKLKVQKETIISSNATMLIHPCFTLDQQSGETKLTCYKGNLAKKFFVNDVINTFGQFAPTASYFIRKEHIHNLPSWFINEAPVGDFFIETIPIMDGGEIEYQPFTGSIYRINLANSWTSERSDSFQKHIDYTNKMIKSLDFLSKGKVVDSGSISRRSAQLYKTLAFRLLECNEKRLAFKNFKVCYLILKKTDKHFFSFLFKFIKSYL